jgi:hypothetical protein
VLAAVVAAEVGPVAEPAEVAAADVVLCDGVTAGEPL